MTRAVVVTGTDTGVGKTVFSAGLVAALDGFYWKPVQAGLEGPTDTETVAALAGLAADRLLPEAYRLKTPASPHIAARRDGVRIEPARLTLPPTERPLVAEAAGGLLVPLTEDALFIDLIRRWQAPALLCACTRLGTINHTLLSVEALRARGIPLLGIAFIGDEEAEVQATIERMSGAPALGRLPMLNPLTHETLRAAFARYIQIPDLEDANHA